TVAPNAEASLAQSPRLPAQPDHPRTAAARTPWHIRPRPPHLQPLGAAPPLQKCPPQELSPNLQPAVSPCRAGTKSGAARPIPAQLESQPQLQARQAARELSAAIQQPS